ncbi:MAG: zinc-binding dehydrogenase [Actinomycetota bacterium]|nr:zinc-binding dehydrogenase [Actinomycetota bacterium]
MRAVVFSAGTTVCSEVPEPEPGAGELLVAVSSAGLNGADLLQRAGHYPPPPGHREDRPGLEIAGRVVGLGAGARRFALGDAVMGIVGGEGQAELAVIHERVAMPVPAALPLEVAGGFPEVFLTAHDALVTQAQLTSGERVLVTGAAGGVGTAAVQLAAALGAEVVAEVRNPLQRAAVGALGATAVGPEEVAAHGPFDVVAELVGGPNLPRDLASLSLGGRVVVIGLGGGAATSLDLGLLLQRRARLFGTTLRNRPLEEKAIVARRVERQVLPLLERQVVRVLVEASYPLDDAAAAYERFTKGAKLGKVLLVNTAEPAR